MLRSANSRARLTLKHEINALRALNKVFYGSFGEAIALLNARTGRIIVTGIGKSGFIGMKMAATLTSLGHKSTFLHPVEAIHGDLGSVSAGDVVVAMSFSGESPEVLKLVKYLRKDFEVKIISIAQKRDSTLGKLSDVAIEVPVKNEGSPHGIAPMASTTATLVIGDMIASALTSPRKFNKGQFARFHPGGGLALSIRAVHELMTKGRDVPLVKKTDTLINAIKKMSGKFRGITGVVNVKEELVGTITDGDIRRFLKAGKYKDDVVVSAVMSGKPKIISKDDTLKSALVTMEAHRVTSLFVLDEKKIPIGIIHIHDIIEGNVIS